MHRPAVPRDRARRCRLCRRLGWPADLERRRDHRRGQEPIVTETALPGDPSDTQARYIEAAVNGVVIACLYAPNGNPQPGPKFAYKLALERTAHRPRRRSCGPASCRSSSPATTTSFPKPRDIYVTTSYRDNALVQPAPREQFQRLLAQGWTDALRKKHPTIRRSSPSGTTCAIAGRAMPACGSITCS